MEDEAAALAQAEANANADDKSSLLSSARLVWLTSHLIVIGCLSKRLLLGFYCEIFQLALILYKRVTYSI